MPDDESVRPAAEPDPASGPEPSEPTEQADPAEPTEPAGPAEPTEQIAQPSPPVLAVLADDRPAAAEPAQAPAPATPREPGRVAIFLKAHAVTLVLAVLLVAAIVWGALGLVSTADWESRAASLSADLTSTEESLADAQATIDDLETARSRAESTATACVGAIADADAMLEISTKIDEKTVVYLDGLNDFMAALNAGDFAAAETIAAEIDKLSVQIEDLDKQVQGHIDDYADAAEGCHVDDAQGV
jgi:F0F1-type ATP synthase membrane subunit b/b'